MNKPDLHVVSFSGGKDSTAMLLKMVELKMPIDIILFCDTGLEFPDLYAHMKKVENHIGIPITIIRASEPFEYLFCEKQIKRSANSPVLRQFGQQKGYGWPGPRQRWCTEKLKNLPRNQFLRNLKENFNVIEYVGIAFDEQYRLNRKANQKENCRHPLVEWKMSEADCLRFCYERGFDWNGLYRHFRRVSCWCCPLQGLDELRILYRNFPKLWRQLKQWDEITWRKFRADYSVEELEKRFAFEEEWQKDDKPLRSKAFYSALKKHMEDSENE